MSWESFYKEPVRSLDISMIDAEMCCLLDRKQQMNLFNYIYENWRNNFYTNEPQVREILVHWMNELDIKGKEMPNV